MAESLLEALNPFSDKTGFASELKTTDQYINIELLEYDLTICESFDKAFNKSINNELDFISDILIPFHLIVGCHYTNSPYDERYGAKGLLDIFILPLLARKLIHDTYSEERKDAYIANLAAWVVSGLIEGLRLGLGAIFSSPFVAIMAFAHTMDALIDYLSNLNSDEQIINNNNI